MRQGAICFRVSHAKARDSLWHAARQCVPRTALVKWPCCRTLRAGFQPPQLLIASRCRYTLARTRIAGPGYRRAVFATRPHPAPSRTAHPASPSCSACDRRNCCAASRSPRRNAGNLRREFARRTGADRGRAGAPLRAGSQPRAFLSQHRSLCARRKSAWNAG